MRKPTAILLFGMLLLGPILGCGKAEDTARTMTPRSTDLGTGLNAVDRSYPRSAVDMAGIVRDVLASLDVALKSDRHDALGGELSAQRADGHTVNVRISAQDRERCQVSVWVAPGDRTLATLVQERITDRIGRETPAH